MSGKCRAETRESRGGENKISSVVERGRVGLLHSLFWPHQAGPCPSPRERWSPGPSLWFEPRNRRKGDGGGVGSGVPRPLYLRGSSFQPGVPVVAGPGIVGWGSRRSGVGNSQWAAGVSAYFLCVWGKNPWFPGSDLITATWPSRQHWLEARLRQGLSDTQHCRWMSAHIRRHALVTGSPDPGLPLTGI